MFLNTSTPGIPRERYREDQPAPHQLIRKKLIDLLTTSGCIGQEHSQHIVNRIMIYNSQR